MEHKGVDNDNRGDRKVRPSVRELPQSQDIQENALELIGQMFNQVRSMKGAKE